MHYTPNIKLVKLLGWIIKNSKRNYEMGIYEHENPCFSETHPRVTAQSFKYSEIAPTKNQTVEFNMFNILVRKGYYLSYITVLEKKAIVVFFYLLQRAERDSFL